MSWTQLGTNASYSVIIDFSLRVPYGLQHGISERGDYANRVQGDAASHALNGAPYWTYMRRRAELSTQVFHSNGSEKALSYTRLVRYGGARLFPMVQYPPVGFPLSNRGPNFPFRSEEHTSELQSLMRISYAVFFLKKKHIKQTIRTTHS